MERLICYFKKLELYSIAKVKVEANVVVVEL